MFKCGSRFKRRFMESLCTPKLVIGFEKVLKCGIPCVPNPKFCPGSCWKWRLATGDLGAGHPENIRLGVLQLGMTHVGGGWKVLSFIIVWLKSASDHANLEDMQNMSMTFVMACTVESTTMFISPTIPRDWHLQVGQSKQQRDTFGSSATILQFCVHESGHRKSQTPVNTLWIPLVKSPGY